MSEQEAAATSANTEVRRRRRPVEDEDEEEDTKVEKEEATLPVRPRAKAPSAAKAPPAPPVAPPPVHADPTCSAGTGEPTPSKQTGRGIDTDDIFKINFDIMKYEDLLSLLQRISRQEVEDKIIERAQQQHETQQQQQSQRVERFLDVAPFVAAAATVSSPEGSPSDGPADGYSYNDMLNRLFETLNRNNEGSAMTERNQLPVPVLEKIGKKKTVISNFGRICEAFHRPMEDVKDFIEKELSIHGNLDSNNALILKFEIRKATDFDRVLIKYLDEFVKCNSCHRIDTTLTKDVRRMELRCNWCTATRTVTAVGTATYSALVEKRSRQRAAMTL